jgi:branched-chain amino acid transport system substrate-binding protein
VIEFQTTATDFAPIVTRVRGHNPDAIWSAGTIPAVIAMLREMESQKINVTVFNDGMIWPGAFPQLAGPSGAKVYTLGFSTNEPTKSSEKHNRYIERFQAKLRGNSAMPQPPNTGNSVMGYEAMYFLAPILERKKIDGTTDTAKARQAVKDGLGETKEFKNIYDVKIDKERNGYIRAHLLKDDPTTKECRYALPEDQR